MSDEPIMYISPEDDLTQVRERLEQNAAKKVTLVVPAHSQLRHTFAWKLLYARARTMGKEVMVVSSDPQIRSMAYAMKFKVAHSLEDASAGKARQASQPGRSSVRQRTSARTSSSLNKSPTGGIARSRQSQPMQAESRYAPSGELAGRGGREQSLVQQGPESRPEHFDEDISSQPGGPFSPAARGSAKQPGPSYGFHIDTSPPIQPLLPEHLEEESDSLQIAPEDIARSQEIRRSALGGSQFSHTPEIPASPPKEAGEASPQPQIQMPPPQATGTNPFASMEDTSSPPPVAEQRGAAPFRQFDSSEHEIQEVADLPMDVLESLQHEEDAEAFVPPPPTPSAPAASTTGKRAWVEPEPEDEQDAEGPERTFGARSRSLRPGSEHVPFSLTPPGQEQKELPPIEDQPTQVTPGMSRSQAQPTPPAQSIPPAASRRPSRELTGRGGGTARPASQPLSQRQQPVARTGASESQVRRRITPTLGKTGAGARSAPASRVPTAASGTATAADRFIARQQRQQRTNRRAGVLIVAVVLLLVVLALGALAYFGPSTDITLTLQTRTYTHALNMTARPGGKLPDAVPAQLQTTTLTKEGFLTATGSKPIGKVPARGFATFKNNGKRNIIVPSGTIISTASGVQFATGAEFSVNVPGLPGNTVLVDVQALQPGANGNVPADSITVIPPDSLQKIAQVNKISSAEIQLKVTNEQPTTGGGNGSAPVVQKKDLDTVRGSLHDQLQQDVKAWVDSWSAKGVHGNPTTSETLVNAPQEGQVVDNTKVSVTLKATVALLFVSNETLQQAAVAQLNDLMTKDNAFKGERVLETAGNKQPVKLAQTKAPSGDTTSMSLAFNAEALAMPNMKEDDVRKMVAGQSISGAIDQLGHLPGVQSVDVKPSPGFVSWVAFWPAHINVIFKPGTSKK
ncbi:MAG: baseplate J/gp47 family protein [Ktedonobacteraceae bacterium]|nr:baseplate J/gp47 family protein [Ktedonobacteraceae bacterium]